MTRRAEIADATGRTRAHDARGTDGYPLDAGTVQLHMVNDLGVLVKESARHLVTDFNAGFDSSTKRADAADGYDALNDATRPNDSPGFDSPAYISWDLALRYGPFALVEDREYLGLLVARTIRVRCQCLSGTGASLTIFAALGNVDAPSLTNLPLAFTHASAPSSVGSVTMDLSALAPAPVMQWTVRTTVTSSTPPASVSLPLAYLWVGTYSTNAGDKLYSVSAWELSNG